MTTEAALKTGRRNLMMRDGVAFVALAAITGVLFAITLFLFRSFSAHRADIGQEAGDAGRIALENHHPHEAIASLRTALSYVPNQLDYELLLAQALGEDGRIDEANNYYLNLREAQPGDGFINLQLARLARAQGKKQQAVDFYRASIFGDWKGEGDVHRRVVRLELADYLIEQKDMQEAQSELQIASSNAKSLADVRLDTRFADSFLQSGDTVDAIKLYQKAMVDSPRDPLAYEKAGRVAYRLGDYTNAHDWLEHGLRESAGNPGSAADPEGDTATLVKNSEQLLLLSPRLAVNRTERVGRELRNRATAKRRLDACVKQNASQKKASPEMQALISRWSANARTSSRDALLSDAKNEDALNTLVYDTEVLTAQLCGPPQGTDALLLIIAGHNLHR